MIRTYAARYPCIKDTSMLSASRCGVGVRYHYHDLCVSQRGSRPALTSNLAMHGGILRGRLLPERVY